VHGVCGGVEQLKGLWFSMTSCESIGHKCGFSGPNMESVCRSVGKGWGGSEVWLDHKASLD
jgi:hypothetical protein